MIFTFTPPCRFRHEDLTILYALAFMSAASLLADDAVSYAATLMMPPMPLITLDDAICALRCCCRYAIVYFYAFVTITLMLADYAILLMRSRLLIIIYAAVVYRFLPPPILPHHFQITSIFRRSTSPPPITFHSPDLPHLPC